jgi:hypothetical protein
MIDVYFFAAVALLVVVILVLRYGMGPPEVEKETEDDADHWRGTK